MKKPIIFILSGPGGAGKTTVTESIISKKKIASILIRTVTVTTREKRPQEKEGKDYFFVTQEEFRYLKRKRFFIESEKVLDNYYGTPKLYLKIAKVQKKNLLLCIDVCGAASLKKKYKKSNNIKTIFITTAKKKDLYDRMKKRDESQEVIKRRVELAKKELQFSKKYDYLIQNKQLDKTIKKVEDIILKQHNLKAN